MNYTPDNWVVFKLNLDNPHYRVLAGWTGGYAQSDSWKINSGIVKVEEDEHYFYFYGASGSCYQCNKNCYGLRVNNAYIWKLLVDQHGDNIEMIRENTDWLNMNWII